MGLVALGNMRMYRCMDLNACGRVVALERLLRVQNVAASVFINISIVCTTYTIWTKGIP